MNTVTLHTQESLTALVRNQLVKIAVEVGVEKPHSQKSPALIEKILATQTTAEVIPVEAPLPPVAMFPGSTEQVEIPSEPVIEGAINAKPDESAGIFMVPRKTFQRQLSALARVTRGSSMPVLSCVLIKFGDGKLSLQGTNLDVHVTTEVKAETTGEHAIAIPHAVLSKFVGKCSSDYLMAEVKGCKLHISDLENKTQILGISAEEFPPAPTPGEVPFLSIGAAKLSKVLRDSVCAASEDKTRYILNGVFIDTQGTDKAEPAVIATDGRRLVRIGLGADQVAAKAGVILPTVGVEVLRSGLPAEGSASLLLDEKKSRLTVYSDLGDASYLAVLKLVDGNYPNYQQVIPKERNAEYKLSSPDLLSAIGRIMVVSGGADSVVKFRFASSQLTLSGVGADIGRGDEKLKIVGEDERDIALNGTFLEQILAAWAADGITLSVKDEVSPLLLTCENRLAVVMPVRLS